MDNLKNDRYYINKSGRNEKERNVLAGDRPADHSALIISAKVIPAFGRDPYSSAAASSAAASSAYAMTSMDCPSWVARSTLEV